MPDSHSPTSGFVSCSECGEQVWTGQLESHLRQRHHIYQYHGIRRSAPDILTAVLRGLCCTEPDPAAWPLLAALADDLHPTRPDAFIASSMTETLHRVPRAERHIAVAAVAHVLAADAGSARLLPPLATDSDEVARLLALRLTHALADAGLAFDPPKIRALRSLVKDRRLVREQRMKLTAVLLRSLGKAGDAARKLLRAFVHKVGKVRAVERLRQLEKLVGPAPAIDELCAELEDLVRMNCPRCGVQMQRREMVTHLWQRHRLVLDGHRVRDPWQQIEQWLDSYRTDRSPLTWARCLDLAERVEPGQGTQRVQRLFLSRGGVDPELLNALLQEAELNRASLCPHCYAQVPALQEVSVQPLTVRSGLLSWRGYRVEVAESGLLSHLEVDLPGSVVWSGPEPEKRLTQDGALMVFAGPLVLVALAVACGLLDPGMQPLLPVGLVLLVALVVAALVQLFWRWPVEADDRAVHHAWTLLVPRLHADGFSVEDSAFVAGLALLSAQRGQADERAGPLHDVLALTEKAAAAGAGVVEHLAALHRLAITDSRQLGGDPVPQLVKQIGRCFDGHLPLAFAEQMLDEWNDDWWSSTTLGRLRVLLCDRAFEAGFEVRDLLDAARIAPALGRVLGTGDTDALARLRLLWSMRPDPPWERCGRAATVFEAAEGTSDLLQRVPDMLLWQDAQRAPDEDGSELPAAKIVVCARGIIFQGTLFHRTPRLIEVVSGAVLGKGGYELIVDGESFPFAVDPERLGDRLEKWWRFYTVHFLPRVAAVHDWHSPSVAATLRARETVPCPECRRPVLSLLGQVGGSLDEPGKSASPTPSSSR